MDNEPDYGEKPIRVTVVDFDMKFGSMVIFLLKFALAAIPAVIIAASVIATALGVLSRLTRTIP